MLTHTGADMTANDPQVPWTDEQWARVNQVIQEEASRARVAATFLPLYGPLPPDTDFVRAEIIPDLQPPPPAANPGQGHDPAGDAAGEGARAQCADGRPGAEERAGRVPARRQRARSSRRRGGLQGIVRKRLPLPPIVTPPPGVTGLPQIWEIRGGEAWDGLLAPRGSSADRSP